MVGVKYQNQGFFIFSTKKRTKPKVQKFRVDQTRILIQTAIQWVAADQKARKMRLQLLAVDLFKMVAIDLFKIKMW